MKATVDKETCTGCELCTMTCPEVFRMEGNAALAYTNPVPEEVKDACLQAAEDCPVEAIEIEE